MPNSSSDMIASCDCDAERGLDFLFVFIPHFVNSEECLPVEPSSWWAREGREKGILPSLLCSSWFRDSTKSPYPFWSTAALYVTSKAQVWQLGVGGAPTDPSQPRISSGQEGRWNSISPGTEVERWCEITFRDWVPLLEDQLKQTPFKVNFFLGLGRGQGWGSRPQDMGGRGWSDVRCHPGEPGAISLAFPLP